MDSSKVGGEEQIEEYTSLQREKRLAREREGADKRHYHGGTVGEKGLLVSSEKRRFTKIHLLHLIVFLR